MFSNDGPVGVVVTGLGAIAPVGIGVEEFWSALVAGRSGIGPITHFDATDFSTRIAGEVDGFEIERWVSRREARKMDRFCQFAVAASALALEDSGIDLESVDRDLFGVVIGAGIGGLGILEQQHTVLLEKGPDRVTPLLVPMMIPDLAAGQVSIMNGLKGPNTCTVTACATGTNCIGDAFELIRRGAAERCLAGGTEAPITPLDVAGFGRLQALSRRNDEPELASRPFDRDRDGFVMGEGAGVVLLEREDLARARGAKIYCRVVGYGMSADAYHITAPDETGNGAMRVMRAAIAEAGINPADIDYINAHGTSTAYNDAIETKAIKEVFGPDAGGLAISSTKSMTGHLLGATGGIEAIACAKSIETGTIPPTINLENPDEGCDLDYTPNVATQREVRFALSNSFGFGGHNAALVFQSPDA